MIVCCEQLRKRDALSSQRDLFQCHCNFSHPHVALKFGHTTGTMLQGQNIRRTLFFFGLGPRFSWSQHALEDALQACHKAFIPERTPLRSWCRTCAGESGARPAIGAESVAGGEDGVQARSQGQAPPLRPRRCLLGQSDGHL